MRPKRILDFSVYGRTHGPQIQTVWIFSSRGGNSSVRIFRFFRFEKTENTDCPDFARSYDVSSVFVRIFTCGKYELSGLVRFFRFYFSDGPDFPFFVLARGKPKVTADDG